MTQRRSGQRLPALSAAVVLLAALLIARFAMSASPAISSWGGDQPVTVSSRPSESAVAPTEPTWGNNRRAAVGSLSRPQAQHAETQPSVRAIQPIRVRIPAIGVDAPVIELGLNADDTLEVPVDFDEAGWWTGGSEPGAPGPAVVVGHVDSRAGPAVFHNLHELRRGDVIELLDGSGDKVRFGVQRLERHRKDAFPTAAVYDNTPRPTLRLITCGGAFDSTARSYVDNVIVFATLLN
jgi:sortase (surface protein transpeptidase)